MSGADQNIARWITRNADFLGQKDALRWNDRTWSYRDFENEVNKAALILRSWGDLNKGERVAYLGTNRPEMIFLLFACAKLGLVFLPLNWRLAVPEQHFILNDAGARVVFVEERFAALLETLSENAPGCRPCGLDFTAQGAAYEELTINANSAMPVSDLDAGSLQDLLLLVYTSGTTGHPKGAELTQNAVFFNALNSLHMHDMTSADHITTILPMFHVGAMCIQTLAAFYSGATVTLLEMFSAQEHLDILRAHRPSLTVHVPTTLQATIDHPDFADTDLSCLRAIAIGSTNVPTEMIDIIHKRGIPVIQVYGATETGPIAIYQRVEDAFKTVGSIGKPALHCEIRLVDEAGEDVATGENGEILVRGPNVASGYWQNEDASAESFGDGWFHSGDVASRDKDGVYWFRDRIKHVIISGGENIYPEEVEQVLRHHPGIAEAAIVGKPHEKWGEIPVAAIVLEENQNLSEEEVLGLFTDQLARYKHPREVMFLDALPRNAMGKVQYHVLKTMI